MNTNPSILKNMGSSLKARKNVPGWKAKTGMDFCFSWLNEALFYQSVYDEETNYLAIVKKRVFRVRREYLDPLLRWIKNSQFI